MITFRQSVILALTLSPLELVVWIVVQVDHMVVAQYYIVNRYCHLSHLCTPPQNVSVLLVYVIHVVSPSFLLVCVYLPSQSIQSCYSEYLNTLGELEGFIDSQSSDHVIVVGDFNVDFDRGGPFSTLLDDFALDLDMSVCDLPYRHNIDFTYERDDGNVRSWIDHILCSNDAISFISHIHSPKSGTILSDHYPLLFQLHIDVSNTPIQPLFPIAQSI